MKMERKEKYLLMPKLLSLVDLRIVLYFLLFIFLVTASRSKIYGEKGEDDCCGQLSDDQEPAHRGAADRKGQNLEAPGRLQQKGHGLSSVLVWGME